MDQKTADALNTLGAFLGKKDIESLTREALQNKYGFDQADVMVLFGGSVPAGADVLAEAMKEEVAKKYIIAGGAGHTTETLREKMRELCPQIKTEGRSEAEIFNDYLKTNYGLEADELECESTNCGNNITYLLDLLGEKNLPFGKMILTQDAAMQRRMDAGMRRYGPKNLTLINYPAYQARVTEKDGTLAYQEAIKGMWPVERYAELLMGDIERLQDKPGSYGPKGLNYVAHVDIPEDVLSAFDYLRSTGDFKIREANAKYANTKENPYE